MFDISMYFRYRAPIMKYTRLHFLYLDYKAASKNLAESLIADSGQTPLEEAEAIVTVGGDGLLLEALRKADGRPIYALTPKDSNSNGFWADHGVETPQDLKERLSTSHVVTLRPIEALITFTNGKQRLLHAFNDVTVTSASGQSALMNVQAEISGEQTPTMRVLGDGLVFSTAFGSTGTNRSYHGPVADIRNEVIIMTGKGVYDPAGMPAMVVSGKQSRLRVDFGSVTHKRPVRIDYDGHTIERDDDGSRICALDIALSRVAGGNILFTTDPALRAFQAIPQRPSR